MSSFGDPLLLLYPFPHSSKCCSFGYNSLCWGVGVMWISQRNIWGFQINETQWLTSSMDADLPFRGVSTARSLHWMWQWRAGTQEADNDEAEAERSLLASIEYSVFFTYCPSELCLASFTTAHSWYALLWTSYDSDRRCKMVQVYGVRRSAR